VLTPDRLWVPSLPGAFFVDPAGGVAYYPGISMLQLTVQDPAGGPPRVVCHVIPNASIGDVSHYRALLERAAAQMAWEVRVREAAGAEAAADADAAAAAPDAPDGAPDQEPGEAAEAEAPPVPKALSLLVSRLSQTLGGPARVPMPFVVGEARLRLGKDAEAADAFEQAAREFGEEPVFLLGRAVPLMLLEDYGAAVEMVRRGVEGLEDLQRMRVDWPTVLGGPLRARMLLEDLERNTMRDPTDAGAHLLLGFYLFAGGEDDAATGVLNQPGALGEPMCGRLYRAAVVRLHTTAEAAAAAAEGR